MCYTLKLNNHGISSISRILVRCLKFEWNIWRTVFLIDISTNNSSVDRHIDILISLSMHAMKLKNSGKTACY